MSEMLSAGVFIEEVPTKVQTVLAVSTSTMGAAGYTPQGPTDEAVLVTSPDQFQRIFGDFVPESMLGLSLAAFYANGGRRAYIVRVVPSDAILGDCRLQSSYANVQLFKATAAAGVGPYTATEATTVFLADEAPIVPNAPGGIAPGVVLRWRTAGGAVTLRGTMNRAGDTAVVGDGAALKFEGVISDHYFLNVAGADADANVQYIAKAAGAVTITVEHAIGGALAVTLPAPTAILVTQAPGGSTATAIAAAVNAHPGASLLVEAIATGSGATLGLVVAAAPLAAQTLPAFDQELDSIVPGTTTFTWRVAGVATTLAFTTDVSSSITTATNAGLTTGTLDTRTGRFSILFSVAQVPDITLPILASYTPASATATVADNGAGGWTGLAGTIDYDTGAYSITFAVAPHNACRVLAAYKNNAWDLAPISKGAWANGIKVQVYGNPDYFTASTASFSRYNVLVRKYNTNSLVYDVVEQFEDVSFTDPTSVQYFPDVINELSDYIEVEEPGSDYALNDLAGSYKLFILAGGDGSTAGKTIAATIPDVPINARSFTIRWMDETSTARTITDDGAGGLSGDVDVLGANTIGYTTGALSVLLKYVVKAGTFVTATYYLSPAESTHEELFGNTAKDYTYGGVAFYRAGANGTFDTTNYSRSQFTAPTLIAGNLGVYALSRVEEILSVIVPDFAGDVTVSGDLLDYAAARAALPHGGDRFIILTTPVGKSPQEAVDWFRYDLLRFSSYAAIYWPWIKVADPLANNRPKLIPPLGHIAGIYARTDSTRNVAKAPAGTIDGQLNFLLSLEYVATQGERDLLYPNKINPLASGTNIGNAVWGARTISADSAWRYVATRRMFMFLEKSIFNSTFWAVFEPNGPGLWGTLSQQVSSFLLGLFNAGYFAGTSPSQAYFVICDDSNNDQSSIDAGMVVVDVGVAPTKPAEFVVFRMAQTSL